MVVLINGSFGVGKSTVAEILQTRFPGSRIYDPEIVGSILMRLPKWIKLRGSDTDDFQNWKDLVRNGSCGESPSVQLGMLIQHLVPQLKLMIAPSAGCRKSFETITHTQPIL